MNLRGKAGFASDTDILTYDQKLHDLEMELERRILIGQQYEAVLLKQKALMEADEKEREKHQVFSVAF